MGPLLVCIPLLFRTRQLRHVTQERPSRRTWWQRTFLLALVAVIDPSKCDHNHCSIQDLVALHLNHCSAASACVARQRIRRRRMGRTRAIMARIGYILSRDGGELPAQAGLKNDFFNLAGHIYVCVPTFFKNAASSMVYFYIQSEL